MRESAVETAVCAAGTEMGISSLKLNGPGDRGKSDRLFMKNGIAAFLEFKKPGEKPTPLQLRFIRQRIADGFPADWCDNIPDGIAFLKKTYGI